MELRRLVEERLRSLRYLREGLPSGWLNIFEYSLARQIRAREATHSPVVLGIISYILNVMSLLLGPHLQNVPILFLIVFIMHFKSVWEGGPITLNVLKALSFVARYI